MWQHRDPTNSVAPTPMDLKLPISIHAELNDEVIESTGVLDLASGEIRDVKYIDFDVEGDGFPAESQ